jgi:glycogen synthase
MKVFMLGREFAPYISGGLGTACYGLTKAMDEPGAEVTFVLPKASTGKPLHQRNRQPALSYFPMAFTHFAYVF